MVWRYCVMKNMKKVYNTFYIFARIKCIRDCWIQMTKYVIIYKNLTLQCIKIFIQKVCLNISDGFDCNQEVFYLNDLKH